MAKKYYRILKEEGEAAQFVDNLQLILSRSDDIRKKAARASTQHLEAIRKLIDNNRGIAKSSYRYGKAHPDINVLSAETLTALEVAAKECDALLTSLDFTCEQVNTLNTIESWLQDSTSDEPNDTTNDDLTAADKED